MNSLFSRVAIAGAFAVTLAAATVGPTQAATSSPTAKTTAASGISESAATMNGVIATSGAAVKDEFYWGEDARDLRNTTPLQTIPAGSRTVSVQAATNSKLTPNTKYYFLLVVFYRNPGSRSFSRYASGGFKSFTTAPVPNSPFTTTTLTHAGVQRLLTHGERLRLTSKFAEKTQVRLFVYARALDRGGQQPFQDPNEKVYISPDTRVIFDHPGVHWVTLRVNDVYRAALARAGTITEGYFYAGYELIHNP